MPSKTPKKIGVLCVHGIGEQAQYDNLKMQAKAVLIALRRDDWLVDVVDTTDQVSDHPPLTLQAFKRGEGRLDIVFDEVYWADLDEHMNLGRFASFWKWGLSQWVARRYEKSSADMQPDTTTALPTKVRLPNTADARLSKGDTAANKIDYSYRLFGVSVVFTLAQITLGLASWIRRRISNQSFKLAYLLGDYLGDVWLYEKRHWHRPTTVEEADQRPRLAVRQRMVRKLVQMAQGDYHQWYVSAHSLGTVVAWNGLSDTAHCLPNFLSEAEWNALPATLKGDQAAGATANMMPPRPLWLGDQDEIPREALFASLGGLLTFGSPLHRYAKIWPRIVPINNDAYVMPGQFRWINIVGRLDSVSAPLEAEFSDPACPPSATNDAGCSAPVPEDFLYPSSKVLLKGHIQYLNERSDGNDLSGALAAWLVSGKFEPPAVAKTPGSFWPERIARGVQWLILWIALSTLVAGIVWGIGHVPWSPFTLEWECALAATLIGSAALPFFFGLIKLVQEKLLKDIDP